MTSIFIETFGKNPMVKVLNTLLTGGKYFDYTKKDLAKASNVSQPTVHKLLPRLIKSGIIKKTRTIGNAELYKLNKKNKIARKLLEIDNILINAVLDEIPEKKVKVIQ